MIELTLTRPLVAASILSGDFAQMKKTVSLSERYGTDLIHCDVMDGVYVKNFTFGMPMIAAIKKTAKKPLDVHLMITKPENHIESFIKSGADIVTFHPDASGDAEKCLDLARSLGCKVGLAFNPDVNIEKYAKLFNKCDIVLVMTVYAGFGGQAFIESTLERITLVRKLLDEKGLKNVDVEVDGGIGEDNFQKPISSGANIIVAGSGIFKNAKPKNVVKLIKSGTLSTR